MGNQLNKMKFATLLALTAGVEATKVIKIDPFNIKNFMKVELMENLIKSTSMTAYKLLEGKVDAPSKVQWGQCDDDKGVFTLDTDSTSADPDPLVKGKDVNLHLVGALSDDITLSKVHIHVTWNGAPLYDEDHTDSLPSSDPVDYKLKWSVPAYAPDGNYVVTLTGVDTDGSSKDFCVTAGFGF